MHVENDDQEQILTRDQLVGAIEQLNLDSELGFEAEEIAKYIFDAAETD